jgi:cysteinyl-tRNA synthetase
LARVDSFVERAVTRVGAATPTRAFDPMTGELTPLVAESELAAAALPDKFVVGLDDDLATPAATAALYETVREGNRALDAGDDAAVKVALTQTLDMLAVLGLWKDDPVWQGVTPGDDLEPVVDGLVKALLAQRTAARARKDYAAADQIRDQLTELGLTIEDTPEGPRWSR